MSTAELEINAWVQSQSTVDGLEAWWRLTEEHPEPQDPPEPEPAPPAQDDFWQEWFGFWQ